MSVRGDLREVDETLDRYVLHECRLHKYTDHLIYDRLHVKIRRSSSTLCGVQQGSNVYRNRVACCVELLRRTSYLLQAGYKPYYQSCTQHCKKVRHPGSMLDICPLSSDSK